PASSRRRSRKSPIFIGWLRLLDIVFASFELLVLTGQWGAEADIRENAENLVWLPLFKVIVANPTMIEAYKAGIPKTNGQPFPDGSKIVKLQWKPKKSTEARSSWKCQTSSRRLLLSKRTARDFRKAVDGDTRCSTTKPHLTSSRPIPAPQT